MSVCARPGVPQWSKVESQQARGPGVTKCDVGRGHSQGVPDEDRRGAGTEVGKQVMKTRCEEVEEDGRVHADTSCKATWGSGRARWTGMCCCV